MTGKIKGYLGIDAGTQGLSVIFCDQELKVLAVGEGEYQMLPGLESGCYEQNPGDWETALSHACEQLASRLSKKSIEMEVLAIGISGQMHGEVLADEKGNCLGPARLWCDFRNQAEGDELTEALGVKMPKRITSARWLWTTRNRSDVALAAKHITTPSGWISYCLTGNWNLGIGDAAGMFPIDGKTLDYDQERLTKYESLIDTPFPKLGEMLPKVLRAGQSAGRLNTRGAKLLGLNEGIPVAPAEGDQPAALAGSLIGSAGMVSVSFGTSVCANSVGDRPFQGVSDAVDHFCAPDGKPINMVWLRNGTTYMNGLVEMFGKMTPGKDAFAQVMPQVLKADADCGGLLAFPFMDDEPGLGVSQGGLASLNGLTAENATPGNVVKAALLATIYNLRFGSEVLDQQGYPREQIILSGGLTRTPELGQTLADVFRVPVRLLESADEGTAWGAALLARYHFETEISETGTPMDWSNFLSSLNSDHGREFQPSDQEAGKYDQAYKNYCARLPEIIRRK